MEKYNIKKNQYGLSTTLFQWNVSDYNKWARKVANLLDLSAGPEYFEIHWSVKFLQCQSTAQHWRINPTEIIWRQSVLQHAVRLDNHEVRQPCRSTTMRVDNHELRQPRGSTITRFDNHEVRQPCMSFDKHEVRQPRGSTTLIFNNQEFRQPRDFDNCEVR